MAADASACSQVQHGDLRFAASERRDAGAYAPEAVDLAALLRPEANELHERRRYQRKRRTTAASDLATIAVVKQLLR
jgi:hypothetical protein